MRTSRPKWPWMAKTPIRQGPEGLGLTSKAEMAMDGISAV